MNFKPKELLYTYIHTKNLCNAQGSTWGLAFRKQGIDQISYILGFAMYNYVGFQVQLKYLKINRNCTPHTKTWPTVIQLL